VGSAISSGEMVSTAMDRALALAPETGSLRRRIIRWEEFTDPDGNMCMAQFTGEL